MNQTKRAFMISASAVLNDMAVYALFRSISLLQHEPDRWLNVLVNQALMISQYTDDPKESVYATFEDSAKAVIDPNGNPYGPYRYTEE